MDKSQDREKGILKKLFMASFIVQLTSMLSTTINSLVDGMVIGKCLGLKEMTAYGYVAPLTLVVSALAVMMGAGTSGACGHTVGGGDKDKIRSCFSSVYLAGAGIGIVCMLLVEVFSGPLAGILTGTLGQTGNQTAKLVQEYLIGYGFNIPVLMLMVNLSSVTQFDGKPRLSMIALMSMSLSNAVLDLLNGLVFHGGMFGMAIATSISSFLAMCILSSIFFRKNHIMCFSFRSFQWSYVRMMLSYGLSASVMMFAGTVTMYVLNHLLGHYVSEDAVAAYAAVFSAGYLSTSVGTSLRVTVVTLVSMFDGEKDTRSQKELVGIELKAAIIINVFVMIVIMACAGLIMRLFLTAGTEPYEMAVTGTRFYTSMILFFSMNMIISGYYQGIRRFRMSVTILLLDKMICVSLLATLLVQFFGADGVWMSYPLGSLLALLISYTILCIRNKKPCLHLSELLSIKEDTDVPDARFTIGSAAEVTDVSAQVQTFCREKGADYRSGFILALATEELANNVVTYGFRENKNNRILVRITKQDGAWYLRMRDDCRLFNPSRYVQLFEEENITDHIGIRMIAGMSSKFLYFSSMKMNQVMICVGGGAAAGE